MRGRVGPRIGSGQTFVGNRGSGWLGSGQRSAGSGPRKGTRGQLLVNQVSVQW